MQTKIKRGISLRYLLKLVSIEGELPCDPFDWISILTRISIASKWSMCASSWRVRVIPAKITDIPSKILLR